MSRINGRLGRLENQITWKTGLTGAALAAAEAQFEQDVNRLAELIGAGVATWEQARKLHGRQFLDFLDSGQLPEIT